MLWHVNVHGSYINLFACLFAILTDVLCVCLHHQRWQAGRKEKKTRKGFLNISPECFLSSLKPAKLATNTNINHQALKQRHCGKLFITLPGIFRQLILAFHIHPASSALHSVDYTAQLLTAFVHTASNGFKQTWRRWRRLRGEKRTKEKSWQMIKKSTMEIACIKNVRVIPRTPPRHFLLHHLHVVSHFVSSPDFSSVCSFFLRLSFL